MKKFLFAFVVLALVSCGTKKQNDPIFETGDVMELPPEVDSLFYHDSEEIETERPVYRETEAVLTDLIHTKLEVNFDWAKSRMNGVETLTAKPHFYSSDSLILDAKGMDILKVQQDGKDLKFTYDSSYLKINLNRTYTRNEQYTVVISYVAKPEERMTGGSQAITSDKGLYFINPKNEELNKMPQIWTQGETEASSVWFPTVDSPNAKSTQEIWMTVDDKYTTLSNGKLISSKKNTNGTRTDVWKQELPHSTYLFMMGVGQFKVVKDFYTRPDGTKMEVNYYVEPEWEGNAKAIFGETPAMIKYFSQLLGYEYPWDKYSQIVVRDYVSGAMENTGAVVFGDYVYKTDRELLDGNDQSTIAHELFHHWFGDLVTAESWSNLPLNESFANYSQYLWDEQRYGLDEADYQAEVEADGYYQSAQMQGYHDLFWSDYEDKEQMFDGHSYNKGGRILHMLRNHLGDEAFFAGLQNYLKTNKFKAAEYHQLRLAFEEVSGQDLNWFFDQWFLGSGHPVIEVGQKYDNINNSVSLSISQRQSLELSPLYRIPIEVAVYDSEGMTVHKIVMDELTETFEFPVRGTFKNVVFDNQQMLLAKIREDKSADQYIFQYYNSKRFNARKEALMNGSKKMDQSGQQLILDALNDPFWYIRLLAIEKASKLNESNIGKGNSLIKDLALGDPNSQVRAAALSYLSNQLASEEMEIIYLDRLEKDQSYLVVSSALKNLGKVNPEKAIAKAKMLENEKSSKMLAGVAQLYGAHGTKENFTFYERVLTGTQLHGFDQLSVMNSMTLYLSKSDNETIDKAFKIYEHLNANGGYYTKMFLPQNIEYLIGSFDQKIMEINDEIATHEKNKDALYADQARKKLKEVEALKTKYESLPLEKE